MEPETITLTLTAGEARTVQNALECRRSAWQSKYAFARLAVSRKQEPDISPEVAKSILEMFQGLAQKTKLQIEEQGAVCI